jgi:GTP-binding protein
MIPARAEFVTSSPDFSKCPPPDFPEYAFVGRSNVGKSSLINMVTGQKMLAKTSSTPGKTQLINHFLIDSQWYLVDLPGYGYARVGRKTKENWKKILQDYLLKRTNLMSVFLLIDSRLSLQDNDRMVINWFGENQVHFNLVFTKTDKLTNNQLASNIASFKNELLQDWEELPGMIITSASNGTGRDPILEFIRETNKLFKPVR